MPDNRDRAERATETVGRYKRLAYGAKQAPHEPNDQAVGDLLADLMHYCDLHGYDFDWQVQKARDHFAAEQI